MGCINFCMIGAICDGKDCALGSPLQYDATSSGQPEGDILDTIDVRVLGRETDIFKPRKPRIVVHFRVP